jgi:hypothetical protein
MKVLPSELPGRVPYRGSLRRECGQWPESGVGNARPGTTSKLDAASSEPRGTRRCLHWGNPASELPDRKTFILPLTGTL